MKADCEIPGKQNFVQLIDTNQQAITAALEIMEKHISALNERNALELSATLHFPHFRLVGTNLKVWETADKYFDEFRARAGEHWAYTKLASITTISATSNKVHLDVQVNRFDAQDHLIADFRSIWVITKIQGVWAAQFRSSFAPA